MAESSPNARAFDRFFLISVPKNLSSFRRGGGGGSLFTLDFLFFLKSGLDRACCRVRPKRERASASSVTFRFCPFSLVVESSSERLVLSSKAGAQNRTHGDRNLQEHCSLAARRKNLVPIASVPPPPARGLARLWFPSGRRLPLEVSFRALCTSTHLAGGGELRRVGARWVASFFLFFSQQACLFEGEGKKARPRQIAFLAPCTPFSLFISISLLRFGVQGADQGDERRKQRNSEARGSSAEDF